MKLSLFPPVREPEDDFSDILDRTDLSDDEKIDIIVVEHGCVDIPCSLKERLLERLKASLVFSDDDDDDMDDQDSDAEEEKGKVLGDEKEPGGIVKRPPQVPPEGEPVYKLPRTTPQGEEPPQFGEAPNPESTVV